MKRIILLFIILGMVASCYMIFPHIKGVSETRRRLDCWSNLEKISQALQSYNSKYGQFPPAYTVDSSGNKLHSWRTLLLPYLGHADIYNTLRLDEPWNSPFNQDILKDVDMGCYRCPTSPHIESPTAYVMVIGPYSVSDGPNGWRLSDLTKRPDKTICIVETNFPFRWYEPEDLKADEITFGINRPPLPENWYEAEVFQKLNLTPCIGSFHQNDISNGVNVLYCDGHAKFLDADTEPTEVKSMIEGKKPIL